MITPFRSLVLCGESRQEMEDWLNALRTVTKNCPQTDSGIAEMLSGNHQWYATSHARPTYCNVCRDALYGKYKYYIFLYIFIIYFIYYIYIIYIIIIIHVFIKISLNKFNFLIFINYILIRINIL